MLLSRFYGDPRQLALIAQGGSPEVPTRLGQSPFQWTEGSSLQQATCMLDQQWPMAPPISSAVSQLFHESKLKVAEPFASPIAIGRPAVNNGQSARLENPDIDRWFDTTVFAPAAPFTFGNVGRRLPDVRTDALTNVAITLAKNFTFGERYRVRFRVASFNVSNTPQFPVPVTAVTNAAFGQMRSQANSPRSIQFGVHLYW
jgi:hypothetical protein